MKLRKEMLEAAKATRGTSCAPCWERWNEPHDPKRCRRKWQADDGVVTVCFCRCQSSNRET